jgi:hypothetical protein
VCIIKDDKGDKMITISEIKSKTLNNAPYFFDSKTMKFFGQTMNSFKVRKSPAGRIFIYASIKSEGQFMGFTFREFTGDDLTTVHNEDGSMFQENDSTDIENYISTH